MFAQGLQAQVLTLGGDSISYAAPKEYVIAKTVIKGITTLDEKVLKLVSGLVEGVRLTVPGDKIADAVKNLWRQGFFDDIQINVTKIEGEAIYLEIVLQEKPRMGGLAFRGDVKKKKPRILSQNFVFR